MKTIQLIFLQLTLLLSYFHTQPIPPSVIKRLEYLKNVLTDPGERSKLNQIQLVQYQKEFQSLLSEFEHRIHERPSTKSVIESVTNPKEMETTLKTVNKVANMVVNNKDKIPIRERGKLHQNMIKIMNDTLQEQKQLDQLRKSISTDEKDVSLETPYAPITVVTMQNDDMKSVSDFMKFVYKYLETDPTIVARDIHPNIDPTNTEHPLEGKTVNWKQVQ
ncbi:hypothetical protein SNEBB_000541 [Seison nebaliae]|nr:hypothetical protein SNEBB_000541 [Seison nebaliae]